ncbi:gamma-glutamylcyclotransferase isoform X1 [Saimiri boliviensis]|uniref:gamma-glutamylcyclotransferase isoform X1 n=1 Tax=Saimiri boliviensis TaxID=27679 RepID=UPI000533ECB8|nr:gamma-glutamylcyclotransferase isoform X1 [Saimiri boliviensis boliviensis]
MANQRGRLRSVGAGYQSEERSLPTRSAHASRQSPNPLAATRLSLCRGLRPQCCALWPLLTALLQASVQACSGTWRTRAARTSRVRRVFYTSPMAATCWRRGSTSETPRRRSSVWPACRQEGVKSGTYVVIEVKVSTQEGREITCRSYLMTNYESAPPSPQYKKIICMGAKENGLPLAYQEKLEAIEPNDYTGKVSEEIEDIIKKGETQTL